VQALTVPLVADDRIGRAVLPEATRLDRHIVDADELARLADKLGGVGGYGPMVYLGAIGGLRWGEVAGLEVRHIDVPARTVAVAETVVRGRRGAVGCRPGSDG
jgi:integrase